MVKLDQSWIKNNSTCYSPDEQFLNLENKDFDEIDNGAFKDIPKVKKINMKGNHLTSFDFKLIKDLKELETLEISNNEIDSLNINTSIQVSLTSLQVAFSYQLNYI